MGKAIKESGISREDIFITTKFPFLFPKDLINFCEIHQITIQACSPLTAGKRLKDPILKKLAQKYQKTTTQLLIRWNLQHRFIPLPKSNNVNRILENFQVFDFNIDENDMLHLDSLNENYRTCWDLINEP